MTIKIDNMKNRLITENEKKIVALKVVQRMVEDNDRIGFPYPPEEQQEHQLEFIETMNGFVIETPYGYNIVNVVLLSESMATDRLDVINQSFTIFPDDSIFDCGEMVDKKATVEKERSYDVFSEKERILTSKVSMAKELLLDAIGQETSYSIMKLRAPYFKALNNMNVFLTESIKDNQKENLC